MKQGQAVAEGTKQSKRDAPDVVAAANSLMLQRVHDFLKSNVTAPPPLPPRAADSAAPFRAPTTITARAAPAAATSADRQKFAFGDGFADVLNEVAVGQALKDSHVADVKAPTYVAKPAPFDLARPDLTSKLTARKTLERLARDIKYAADERAATKTKPTL